jgi:predicted amidohydrolase/GNAT superfamily N-acetyltransferase
MSKGQAKDSLPQKTEKPVVKGVKAAPNKMTRFLKAIKSRSAEKSKAPQLKENIKIRKKGHKLVLRPLERSDFSAIKEMMDELYPNMGGAWTPEQLINLLTIFPEGQLCIADKGKMVATALALIVDYSRFGDNHTYAEITGQGSFSTHDPNGDTLYGIDIFVHKDYRHLRLGRRLYDARKELCEQLNLRAIIAGGRIPGYRKYAGQLTPRQYIELVKGKELVDPVLSFQLANDFHVRKIISGYEPTDVETRGYATLLEWINIYYEKPTSASNPAPTKQVVRVGAIQWQMRQVASFEDLIANVEFFIDALAGYKADFALLPEFFCAPLMAHFGDDDAAQAIRRLAENTLRMRQELQRLAVSYNINIIAGSMPEYKDMELRNVSYLMRRDGTWEAQYKLHVTPDERSWWGLKGGDGLKVFNTDVGKIGILICYDVEFPETARLLADQGMSILFVPYWTDTRSGYLRVRTCAQARAIENECYVVATGSVGNLPNVQNMDVQYSQSAIFTPSDFSFPHDAIAAEATPNTEMLVMADLDLSLLRELRARGSVRNLADRRHDLYELNLVR